MRLAGEEASFLHRSLFVAASLLFIGLVSVAPAPAAAHTGSPSCGDTATEYDDYWSCTFVCHRGEELWVRAETTHLDHNYPRVRATCGGVDIYCQGYNSCTGRSSSTVAFDDTGVCYAETVYVDGSCDALMRPGSIHEPRREVSFGDVTTPEVSSMPVGVPGIARVCLGGGLLCIGPGQPITVGQTPEVESTVLMGGGSIVVERNQHMPFVTTTTVNATTVDGPLPVTVCATPCEVPSGVDTNGFWIRVTLTLGDETVEHEFIP